MTEKSMAGAREGKYTFKVPYTMRKSKIKVLIGEIFGVSVDKVWVIRRKSEVKSNYKKAIVSLKGEDKISLFGEEKKSKKK